LTSFDFGYAMTVHKAQGSEWPNVILIDEYYRRLERTSWVYTGITRASERIIVTPYPPGYREPAPLPF
jgi:exodeoxyribonuclease-5